MSRSAVSVIYTVLEIAGLISGVILLDVLNRTFFGAPRGFNPIDIAVASYIFAILALLRSVFRGNSGIQPLSLLLTSATGSLLLMGSSFLIGLAAAGAFSDDSTYGITGQRVWFFVAAFLVLTMIEFFAALAFKSAGRLMIPSAVK